MTLADPNKVWPLPLLPLQSTYWAVRRCHYPDRVIIVAFDVAGAVDISRLQNAFERVALRHTALRLRFIDGRQTLGSLARMTRFDVIPPESTSNYLRRGLTFEPSEFDEINGPLCRVRIVSRDDRSFRVILGLHHIVGDGRSIQILLDDLGAEYRAATVPERQLEGKQPDVDPHADEKYAVLVHEIVADAAASEQYWAARLSNMAWTGVPRDLLERRSADMDAVVLQLDHTVVAADRAAAAAYRSTRFQVYLAAVAAALGEYCDTDSVALRLAIDLRPGLTTVGCLTSVVVLNVETRGRHVAELVPVVRDEFFKAFAHRSGSSLLVQRSVPSAVFVGLGDGVQRDLNLGLGNMVTPIRVPDPHAEMVHPDADLATLIEHIYRLTIHLALDDGDGGEVRLVFDRSQIDVESVNRLAAMITDRLSHV